MDVENLISFSEFNLSSEDLKSLILSYKLKEESGIGLVIVAENMNQPDNYTSSFIIFFDIKSREKLWVEKIKGKLKGAKFTKYYYYGFYNSFEYWVNRIYKKQYKKYFKL